MIPNTLKAVVTDVQYREVKLDIFRLDDPCKVMEITVDRDVMVLHTHLTLVKSDGSTEKRGALYEEIKKGVQVIWKRDVRIKARTSDLGVFLAKITVPAPEKAVIEEIKEFSENRPISRVQQMMRDKAQKATEGATLDAQERESDAEAIVTREIPESDDPNSIQQKMRRMASSLELDDNLEEFRGIFG